MASLPLHELLEINGIRVMICPTVYAKEVHKLPYGVAVCAVGGITSEHVELLKLVNLAGWYCSYSFEQGDQKYSGYIIAQTGKWLTEQAAREFLEQRIELACEKCGGEGTYFSTHEIPDGSRYYCMECEVGRALMEAEDA